MALTTCNPCCNPEQLAKSQDSYRAAHLKILCLLRELLENLNDYINVVPLPPSVLTSGRKVVASAGIPEAIVNVPFPCKKVDVQAEVDNTGTIVVGDSTVIASLATRQGIALMRGQFYSFEIDDASKIYIDSTVNGEGIVFNITTQ